MATSTPRFPTLFNDPFEDVFKNMMRPMRWELEPVQPQIRLDVEENDKGYTVKAEIPGVKKEDIHVRIDGNTVTISAEAKQEKDTKENGRVIRSERYYGTMQRVFSLASDVDDARAEARYDNGILNLSLPKKAAAASKRLQIT